MAKSNPLHSPVRTSNELLMARYKYTAHEIDLMMHIIRQINGTKSDQPDQYAQINIPASMLLESFGNSGRNYDHMRKAFKGILKKPFEFYIDGHWHICNFISYAHIDANRGSVVVRIDQFMLQLMRDLKKEFTSFELRSILKMDSAYSKRIYMMLCQFRSTGIMSISTDELRTRLGITDIYPLFSDLKRRVLDTSLIEINEHSEFNAQLQELKQGRRIDHLHFSFTHKDQTLDMMGDEKQIRFMVHHGLADWQIENVIITLQPKDIHDVLMAFQERLKDRTKAAIANRGAYLCQLFIAAKVPMNKQLPRQLQIPA